MKGRNMFSKNPRIRKQEQGTTKEDKDEVKGAVSGIRCGDEEERRERREPDQKGPRKDPDQKRQSTSKKLDCEIHFVHEEL
jgi:hypothetical protein